MQWPRLCKALEYLVSKYGPIDGRTRLLKLVYLADQRWAQKHRVPYTEARYYRWNHGPYAREVLQALEWLDGVEIREQLFGTPTGSRYSYARGERSRLDQLNLDPEFVTFLDEEASTWKNQPLQALLDHVYAEPQFKKASFGEKLLTQG